MSLHGLRVGVFGLGEAGSEIGADLARAGATVTGYDPADVVDPPGVRRVNLPADAVRDAALVLAVTAAVDARVALTQALDAIAPGALYADLSTASPGSKRDLAAVAAGRGLLFADVALMGSVPGNGLATPAVASGDGAARYVELLAPASAPVDDLGPEPGLAAISKLLRSVVVKGLAAVVIESLRAADAAGLADETWANVVDQLVAADEDFVRRLVSGTAAHATRRLREMEAAAELLRDLGVDPVMTEGAVESLRRVMIEGVPEPPAPRPGQSKS